MTKMWHHNCIEMGPTATEHGEPCNWCDVTQEHIEEQEVLNKPIQLEGADYNE